MAVRFDAERMSEFLRANHEHNHQHESSEPISDNTRSSADMHMGMVFHFADSESILFTFWQTDSATSMAVSCFIVFLVAIFYEGLKFYRQWLLHRDRLEGGTDERNSRRSRRRSRRRQTLETQIHDGLSHTSVLSAVPGNGQTGDGTLRPWLKAMHLYQTILHMIHVFMAFMLMLIFMTFNVWLCAAVVLGAGLGYFIFFVKSSGVTDHCP